MALPKLVVEIAARIREYMADMDKAATATEASAARIERADKTMADAAKDAATGQATMADTAVQVATRMGPVGGVVAAAAAVVAGYAAASYKAAQENTALVRALALSGQQAGVTAGQLQGMAAAASQVVGTHGQAAEAIGLMVSGGKVAGENLQALTVTALNASRTLGIGVQETVKHYEALADSPAKASAKLNETMGYLNAETYRRIQALEEMGRKDEAAALAQQTYAKGVDDATKKVEASLGYVQRGWRAAGEAAGWAWDKFLGLGRKDEVQDSLAGLRQKLDEKERQLRAGFATTGGGAAVGMRGLADERRGQLEAEAEALREQIRLLSRAGATAAANAAESARWGKRQIEIIDEVSAAEYRRMTNAQKLQHALAKLDAEVAKGDMTREQRTALAADAERQFADKVTRGNDGVRERNALLKAQQQGLDDLVKDILAREKAEEAAALATAKAYDQAIDRQNKATASAEQELERQLDLNAAMGLGKEAVAELAAAKLEETAATKERQAALADDIDWSGRMGDAYRDEAAALYALAKAKREGAAKAVRLDNDKAWKKEFDDMAKEGQRVAQKIEDSLTDSLMRGFEAGKGFLRNLADTAVNMFKTLVLRPTISAIVSPVAGAITASLGLTGTANAGQGGSLLGNIGTASSAYNAINGGITNSITAGFNNLASSGVGQSLGLSVEAAGPSLPGMSAPTQLTSFGQTASSWATTIGGTMAGIALGSMAKNLISGGYSAGKGMDTFQNIGVAVGSAIGGPLVGAIIGAGAGVFNRAFGRKLKDQGIQGEFGGEAGFTGENYQFLKGGWFRSDKTKTSPLDADMQSGLANQFKAIQLQTALMATALGDTGQSVADFTSSIKVSFNGLTEAQIGEKLTETFEGIANDMAQTVLGDSAFAKEGEVASQTLQRLSTSLTTVNATWDALGFSLEAVSLAGGSAASSFIDLMGGLENFTAATAGYFANFHTEAERADFATEQLAAQLAALGQTMPATRDGFRALVEAAEQAGNDKLLAGLLNLQDEFAALVPAADKAATAADKYMGLLDANAKKYLNPDQYKAYTYERASTQLKGLGFDFSADILSATDTASIKAWIVELARTGAVSSDTLASLIALADGLIDVKGSADSAGASVANASSGGGGSYVLGTSSSGGVENPDITWLRDSLQSIAQETRDALQQIADGLVDSTRNAYEEVDYQARLKAEASGLDGKRSQISGLTGTIESEKARAAAISAAMGSPEQMRAYLESQGWVLGADATDEQLAQIMQSLAYNANSGVFGMQQLLDQLTTDFAGLDDSIKAWALAQKRLTAVKEMQTLKGEIDSAYEQISSLNSNSDPYADLATKLAKKYADYESGLGSELTAQIATLQGQADPYTAALADGIVSAEEAATLGLSTGGAGIGGTTDYTAAAIQALALLNGEIGTLTGESEDMLRMIAEWGDAQEALLNAQRRKEIQALLDGDIKQLYGSVDSTAGMQTRAAQQYIDSTLASLKNGGQLPDPTKLREAVDALKTGLGNATYNSQFEEDRARLILAGQLGQIKQLTVEEETLDIAYHQLDALAAINGGIEALVAAATRPSAVPVIAPAMTPVVANFAPVQSLMQDSQRRDETLVSEIRALRAENKAQAESLAALNLRLVKLHERWDGRGLPETRAAV